MYEENDPTVKQKIKYIYWPHQNLTVDNYQAIQKHPHAIGGVISVIFTEPLKNIYDRIIKILTKH